jgi:hypothetical protein
MTTPAYVEKQPSPELATRPAPSPGDDGGFASPSPDQVDTLLGDLANRPDPLKHWGPNGGADDEQRVGTPDPHRKPKPKRGHRGKVGNILTVEHTDTSRAIYETLSEADGLYDELITVGTKGDNARELAAEIATTLADVDARLTVEETKDLSDADAAPIAVVRRSWERLRDETAETLVEVLGTNTGIGLIDKGLTCEPLDGKQAPAEGCFVSSERRHMALLSLHATVSTSMGNYRDAIQNARVDELLESPHGWGFLAEFLFNSVSGGLIGAALKGLAIFKEAVEAKDALAAIAGVSDSGVISALTKRIASVSDETFKAVLSNASRGIRNEVRAGYTHYLGKVNRARAGFLEILQEQIKPLADNIVLEAPTVLDDAGLLALVGTYANTETNSVASYRGYVDDMVAMYEASKISEIGNEIAGGGRYELSESGGVYKVIKRHGTGVVKEVHNSVGGRADQYYVIYDDGRIEDVATVPEDLEFLAIAINDERQAEREAKVAADDAKRQAWRDMQSAYKDSEQNRRLDRRGR